MGKFDTASAVENAVWEMRLADYPRSVSRGRICDLMNGVAPYSNEEALENNLSVNYNDLTGPVAGHDARGQIGGSFQKTANFFKVGIDRGPVHRRGERSTVITKEIN